MLLFFFFFFFLGRGKENISQKIHFSFRRLQEAAEGSLPVRLRYLTGRIGGKLAKVGT